VQQKLRWQRLLSRVLVVVVAAGVAAGVQEVEGLNRGLCARVLI
jgi:hypothetical protein